jgi:hypothetical protein
VPLQAPCTASLACVEAAWKQCILHGTVLVLGQSRDCWEGDPRERFGDTEVADPLSHVVGRHGIVRRARRVFCRRRVEPHELAQRRPSTASDVPAPKRAERQWVKARVVPRTSRCVQLPRPNPRLACVVIAPSGLLFAPPASSSLLLQIPHGREDCIPTATMLSRSSQKTAQVRTHPARPH